MSAKELLDNRAVEATLTVKSKKILEDYLTPYKEISQEKIKNAILTIYYYDIEKDNFADWTFEDYTKIVPEDLTVKLTTKQSHIKNFFIYLYIFDYLENEKGFGKIWLKEAEKQKYLKGSRKGNKKSENTKVDTSLNIEEIFLIQNVLATETEDVQILKMQFTWFAIFELGMEIEVLRKKLDPKLHYIGGELKIVDNMYVIPEKFHIMFERLKEKDIYNGFKTTDILLEQLGEYADLKRKLIPRDIKAARDKLFIECRNCKNAYTNISENWVAINSRIICKDCGESLKKKFEFQIVELEHSNIASGNSSRTLIFQDFEELQQQLKHKTIDYLKLHEFQIEIGKLGEIFTYNYEREKLRGTKYLERIDRTKSLNPENGYDILSYDLKGKEICIEVKSTVTKKPVFYISNTEVDMYTKVTENGGKYYVYFISEIMSENPQLTIIENLLKDERLRFVENGWVVSFT